MFDPLGVIGVIVFTFALAFVGYQVVHLIADWWFDDRQEPMKMATPKKTDVPMYCTDCGKSLISYRSMDGYDTKTGAARYSFARACSDATQRGSLGQGHWPYCGNRIKQDNIASGHTHRDEDEATTDCPACIDVMLRDGVIGYAQALALYGKIEFTQPWAPESDPTLALYRQMLGSYIPPSLIGPPPQITPPNPRRRNTTVKS